MYISPTWQYVTGFPTDINLQYVSDVKPDYTQLNKMKVGDLRKILTNWGEGMACAGCMEKGDYVKVVRQLMPKYEPEEWKKIEAAEKSEL